MGAQIADLAADFEGVAREVKPIPEGIASVSWGLDRMSVRMSETVEGEARRRRRERSRTSASPPTKEHHYRKA